MYEVTKNVILSGNYELTDILGKIDALWIQGRLTDTERMDLVEMARAKAEPANTFAPLQDQIDALAERIAKLENAAPIDPDVPAEEYPEYVQPTGSHDAYHNGDKVTFNGKHYVCIAPEGVAVVWSPDVYPAYWEVIE
jgi:hypothetical protein